MSWGQKKISFKKKIRKSYYTLHKTLKTSFLKIAKFYFLTVYLLYVLLFVCIRYFPKGIFPSDKRPSVKFPKDKSGPLRGAAGFNGGRSLWQGQNWEIAHLGSCHLGKYPWEVDTLEKSFGKASSHHIFVILPFVLEQSQTNDVFVFHNFMGSTVHVVFKFKIIIWPCACPW